MKNIKLILILILPLLIQLLLYNHQKLYAQEKAITLKLSNFFPPTNRISIIMDEWCKEVEKRTSGRVKVTQFPGGTLTPAAQTYDGVIRGIADIGLSFASYTMGRFPLTEVIDLPLGYKNGYVGAKLVNEYYKRFKPKEFDEVKVLFLHTSPPHTLFTKKPVYNLSDLKGLKIRSTGTSAKVVQALGGVPVAMPMSDAYDALSRGIAEGIVCPFEPMKGFKLAEVVKFCTLHGSAFAQAAFVVMNKDRWNSLPAEIQRIIDNLDEEWIEKIGKLWDELNEEGRDVFIKAGGKIIELSKEEDVRWARLLYPILDEYLKKMQTKGLPGEEALKFCQDFLKTHQK